MTDLTRQQLWEAVENGDWVTFNSETGTIMVNGEVVSGRLPPLVVSWKTEILVVAEMLNYPGCEPARVGEWHETNLEENIQ